MSALELEFSGEVVYWRGPAPWHFIAAPPEAAAEIEALSAALTYGWGAIPVEARIGGTTWPTSLFPKDGTYLVPVKARVRAAEGIDLGDVVRVRLTV